MANHLDTDLLETLLRPFQTGALTLPSQRVLFLRARPGAALRTLEGVQVTQFFKPLADELVAQGYAVVDENTLEQGAYDLVLMLPPRARDEAQALYARALDLCSAQGRILICVANNDGAKSAQNDLQALVGSIATDSKNKCRVIWTAPKNECVIASDIHARWLRSDAITSQADTGLLTRPGVFSWEHADLASRLLADALPSNLRGRAADLGSGIGYLADVLLSRNAGITSVDHFEADRRALELCEQNMHARYPSIPHHHHWVDVAQGINDKFDVIVSNPPFHGITREGKPEVGQAFIRSAAQALTRGGEFWMVANRHLPYEAQLMASFRNVQVKADLRGYKVLRATHG